jgi:nitrile hydratase subunit beta
MNGAHDMGGMHGFGAVRDEPEDDRFHGEWERRAFALTLACGGLGRWNIDRARSAREQQPPAQYLENTYYEQWLHGLVKALQQGSPYTRDVSQAPRFAIGDTVRVRVDHPTGHTRAPRYVRGRTGTVVLHHGAHVYADASARGEHGVAHHLYNVAFDAAELWGAEAQDGAVHLDLWEPYLERP